MKSYRAVVVACLACAGLLGTGASYTHAGGSADLELSRVEFLADGWSGVESLKAKGLRVEGAPDSWPIRIVFGVQRLDQEESFCPDFGAPCSNALIRVEASFISLGIAYRPWSDKPVHPRLGAGFTRIDVELETVGNSGRRLERGDNSGYLEAGLEWSIAKRWHAAGAVRRTIGSTSDGTTAGLGLNSQQFTLSFGYVW